MSEPTTKRHGGQRPGSGRKPHGYRSISVTLAPKHIEYLKRLGAGNASEGIRRLTQQAIEGETTNDQPTA